MSLKMVRRRTTPLVLLSKVVTLGATPMKKRWPMSERQSNSMLRTCSSRESRSRFDQEKASSSVPPLPLRSTYDTDPSGHYRKSVHQGAPAGWLLGDAHTRKPPRLSS